MTSDSQHRPRFRVVFLGRVSAEADKGYANFLKACRDQSAEMSRQIDFDFVDTDERPENDVPEVLHGVLRGKPNLLLAPNGDIAALAARHAAGIPLVFSSYVHPVREGIVSSMLRRPEPVTGIWVSEQLDGKRLETLHDAYPSIRRVAVLMDRSWNNAVNALAPVEDTARRLGLSTQVLLADTAEEAQALLDNPDTKDFDAWLVPRSYLAVLATPLILQRLRAWHKPVILGNTADVRSGAPLSYAVDTRFVWPALADLTFRVLGGENAGDIPIQRPQRFVLAIRTSNDTELPLPRIEVVRRADLVIR